jgi:hypothetical protein
MVSREDGSTHEPPIKNCSACRKDGTVSFATVIVPLQSSQTNSCVSLVVALTVLVRQIGDRKSLRDRIFKSALLKVDADGVDPRRDSLSNTLSRIAAEGRRTSP